MFWGLKNLTPVLKNHVRVSVTSGLIAIDNSILSQSDLYEYSVDILFLKLSFSQQYLNTWVEVRGRFSSNGWDNLSDVYIKRGFAKLYYIVRRK